MRSNLYTWLVTFAIAIVIGFMLVAVMLPLPAHAAGQETAHPGVTTPPVVATQPEEARSSLKRSTAPNPPGFGWFLAGLFLLPAATYFTGWCLFKSDKP